MSTKVRFLTSVVGATFDYTRNDTATIDDAYAATLISVGKAMPCGPDVSAACVAAFVGDGYSEVEVQPSGTSASGLVYARDETHYDVVFASGQVAHFAIRLLD